MFVLGIDPGLTRMGYGLLGRTSSGDPLFDVLTAGVIESAPSMALEHRLGLVAEEIDALLDELQPSVVVVEQIFFQTNVRTAIPVAQASGIVIAAAARRQIDVAHLTANEVKLAIVGHGGATKRQVQQMVARLCGLAEPPSPPDVADAMALAACHLGTSRLRAAILEQTR